MESSLDFILFNFDFLISLTEVKIDSYLTQRSCSFPLTDFLGTISEHISSFCHFCGL
jgi:hypothetical protein